MKKVTMAQLYPYVLGVIQIFIGVTAVIGGFGLVSDPSGAKMSVPLELLKHTPFTSYLVPGLVLIAIIGVSNLVAGLISFFRRRRAAEPAIVLGAFLMLYMCVEVWMIGLQNASQPLYFVLGAAELSLGLRLFKAASRANGQWIDPRGAKLPT